MSLNIDREREWWNSLEGEEIIHNTAGNPPYDVEVVADFLDWALSPDHGQNVLDLGCGIGRLTNRMAEGNPGATFYGTDIAPSFVEIANRYRPDNARFYVGDGRNLYNPAGHPFPFDAAYSVTVFQHLDRTTVAGYIRQVWLSLEEGGPFAFTWSEGTEDTFLSHQARQDVIEEMCVEAGFRKVAFIDYKPHPAGWRWCVAR